MHRKFYYLCGLPRAGNTLFASLMNQNPTISATANSPVCSMITGAELLNNKVCSISNNYCYKH